MMGSPESEEGRFDNEGPLHEVRIPEFYLGRYPVTNEQYARFLKGNPGAAELAYWADRSLNQPRQPVVGVSWDDAQRYAEWAGLRLPSEAEWEYVARAGTTTPYWWGDEVRKDGKAWANCYDCGSEWGGKKTAPVGSFPANGFGLHDMHGNVLEWVEDDWHGSYEGAPDDGSAWVAHPRGSDRVMRGGSWISDASYCRSANRYNSTPGYRYNILGFRLSRSVAPGR
jgi:formylglycine-generating enzyme required for sulfatase activity